MSCPRAGTMFAEYIRLLVSRLGLPSEYDYWLAEYSPNIPLKSITTSDGKLTLSTESNFKEEVRCRCRFSAEVQCMHFLGFDEKLYIGFSVLESKRWYLLSLSLSHSISQFTLSLSWNWMKSIGQHSLNISQMIFYPLDQNLARGENSEQKKAGFRWWC